MNVARAGAVSGGMDPDKPRPAPAGKVFYKVLAAGRSPIAFNRMKWSLPKKDGRKWKPGRWEKHDGELVRCATGLHVTTDPKARAVVRTSRGEDVAPEVYVAEVRGDVIGPYGDEWVAHEVRLIRKLNIREMRALGIQLPRRKLGTRRGPFLRMLDVLVAGNNSSPRKLGYAICSAIKAAATAGIKFGIDDFERIAAGKETGLWCAGEDNGERMYETLIRAGNESAIRSFERWRGRKPFIVEGERLFRGCSVQWRVKGERVSLEVSRFDDNKGTVQLNQHDRSVYYVEPKDGKHYTRENVVKRYSVSHVEIDDAEKDRRLRVKRANLCVRLRDALEHPRGHHRRNYTVHLHQVSAWTDAQRAELLKYFEGLKSLEWGKYAPEPPAFVIEAADQFKRERERSEIKRELQDRNLRTSGKRYAFEVEVSDEEIDAEERARAQGRAA